MPTPTIEYFALSVADLDVARTFYAEAFDIRHEEAALDIASAGIRSRIIASSSGLRVELIEREGSTPQSSADVVTRARAQGFTHVALRVDDLDAAVESVRAAGGSILSEPCNAHRPSTRFSYVADLDGNLLELVAAS
jgi:predicted enzyme related to lactoylglutathione lyase